MGEYVNSCALMKLQGVEGLIHYVSRNSQPNSSKMTLRSCVLLIDIGW